MIYSVLLQNSTQAVVANDLVIRRDGSVVGTTEVRSEQVYRAAIWVIDEHAADRQVLRFPLRYSIRHIPGVFDDVDLHPKALGYVFGDFLQLRVAHATHAKKRSGNNPDNRTHVIGLIA